MLEVAEVTKDDVVFDLGSGDGRIVITAAKKYGAKAVGYEIDRRLVRMSRAKIAEAKLDQLVKIEDKDLFKADLSPASVITLYLGIRNNQRMIPQLRKLKPGSRIVSHEFPIPGIKPAKTFKIKSQDDDVEHTIYYWVAPLDEAKINRGAQPTTDN